MVNIRILSEKNYENASQNLNHENSENCQNYEEKVYKKIQIHREFLKNPKKIEKNWRKCQDSKI